MTEEACASEVRILNACYTRNGDGGIRTLDPLLARQVLSQLSYTPMDAGLPSFEAIPYSLYLFQSASHLLHYPFG